MNLSSGGATFRRAPSPLPTRDLSRTAKRGGYAALGASPRVSRASGNANGRATHHNAFPDTYAPGCALGTGTVTPETAFTREAVND